MSHKFQKSLALLCAAAMLAGLTGCSTIQRTVSAPESVTSPNGAEPGSADVSASEAQNSSSNPSDSAQSTVSATDSSENSTASGVSEADVTSSAESLAESVLSEVESTLSSAESLADIDDVVTIEPVFFDPTWEYGANSKINSGIATLYHAKPSIAKGITVCVNAGHGTSGGSSVKTLCHPDGTPKVTGGTTAEGQTEAVAVSTGMDFTDGTPEASVTLALAKVVRETLLESGYDVLMIRETEDVQLDNIARTLMANNYADCHIALHYDGTDYDKGVFYMSVPSNATYRAMEPVASHWEEHNRLGEAVVSGIAAQGFSLFDNGSLEMDLTQTSYSTVPSIDLEVGDSASDHSGSTFPGLAAGIRDGLDAFFETAD